MKQNHKQNCQCGRCKAIRGETKDKNNPHYGHFKYNISENFLIKEYTKNKKSMKQIAKIVGCTTMTIFHKLIKYNIPTRNYRESNFWLGKKRPEHSKIMKGKKNLGVSKANKKRTGEKALGYKHGETLKKHYCIELDCNNEISYSNWKKGNKRCGSCANRLSMIGNIPWNKNKKCPEFSGKNNPFFGKTIKPNWGKYKNVNMRSSYEILYAQFLDLSGIGWRYESKTFDLGNTTYTPDFYIPEWDLYIEIKGYVSDVFKKKLPLFKKQYPKVRIKVLMKPELQSMGVLE